MHFRYCLAWMLLSIGPMAVAQEWRSQTVYQIYPRSFRDTDGDGIGDIRGIIRGLPHIRELGYDAIWLSPFFLSPQRDFGYDISGYRDIAPEYGDMALCDSLIATAHGLGLKVILDLVMNHTSDEHPWFAESASSRSGPMAERYVWADGRGRNGRRPPNNWKAMIGGSGWHYHSGRGQWYWASFLPFQPDLNYRDPATAAAMLDVARFWLAKGADGFRLDIFNSLFEDPELRNNPPGLRLVPSEENPDGFFQKAKYSVNQPESFAFATQLRALADSFSPPRFLVGEVFGDFATIRRFVRHEGRDGLHAVFLFRTLGTPLKAKKWRETIQSIEQSFPHPLIPTYVLSNHDRKRSLALANGDPQKFKLLTLMQMTVRGMPFTYNGEELGIPKPRIPMRHGLDPLAQRYGWVPQFLIDLSGESLNRDECRTPMLWDASPNGGFGPAGSTPWLPLSGKPGIHDAATQWADSSSLLRFYQRVLALRGECPALTHGRLTIDHVRSTRHVLAYWREHDGDRLLVMLNMSAKPRPVDLPKGDALLHIHRPPSDSVIGPYDAVVIRPSH